jgi:hypothetical protein
MNPATEFGFIATKYTIHDPGICIGITGISGITNPSTILACRIADDPDAVYARHGRPRGYQYLLIM